jgi:hypothetical protein
MTEADAEAVRNSVSTMTEKKMIEENEGFFTKKFSFLKSKTYPASISVEAQRDVGYLAGHPATD